MCLWVLLVDWGWFLCTLPGEGRRGFSHRECSVRGYSCSGCHPLIDLAEIRWVPACLLISHVPAHVPKPAAPLSLHHPAPPRTNNASAGRHKAFARAHVMRAHSAQEHSARMPQNRTEDWRPAEVPTTRAEMLQECSAYQHVCKRVQACRMLPTGQLSFARALLRGLHSVCTAGQRVR